MMEILLSSALLVLVLALLRRLLRGRIDPRLQYGLWLLVALRLLIPGALFTLPVSLSGAAAQLGASIVEALPEKDASPEQESGASAVLPQEDASSSAVTGESVSVSTPSGDSAPASPEDTAAPPQPEENDTSAAAEPSERSEPSEVSAAQRLLSLLDPLYDAYTETAEYPLGTSQDQLSRDILDRGYFINGWQVDLEGSRQIITYSRYASIWDMPFWRWPWYAGMAVMACLLAGTNLRFALTLRKKRRQLSQEDLPADCRVPVYLVEDLASPCLCGLLRPAIYINARSLAPGRLTHILAHEQAHLRHGDHLWALLRMVCLCVYWFDPFVWWAAVLSRRDGELACDHSAIRRLGEDQRLEYGQTLVDMIAPGRALPGLLRTATTMTDKKRTMRERILLIAKRPQMAIATLVLVLLGTVLAAVLAFSDVQNADNADDGGSISRLSFSAPEGDSFLNRREGVYTFLIVGLDDTSEITDTLLLATYDVKAGEVNFLSIPRDTAVDVPWEYQRISTVYGTSLSQGGGIESLRQQVRDLTGVFPDYYFVVDTDAVGQLVGALGGVWFDVPQDMDYDDPYQDLYIHQEAGYRLLTGEDAMEIVRFRSRGMDGDMARIQVQQDLMKAVIQQCLALEDWSDVLELAGVFSGNVTTDLSADNLLWFAQQGVEIDGDQLRFFTLPCSGAYENSVLYLLADPEETAALINQYFNPYTYDISFADLCRMAISEEGELVRTSASRVHVAHSAGLFSFDLQMAEEDLAAAIWTEDAMGLTLYQEEGGSWFLQILPQPEDWLESHPSDDQILLTSFTTNGTAQRYVLAWNGDFLTEAQRQAVADSFTLTLDAARISQLVHDSYETDMAAAIAYLPYLSWSSYRDLYGDEGLGDLLSALWSYADSGQATWNQVHDILSVPVDEAIDGAYATAYQDTLWALYRSSPDTFASVAGSVYITGAERDNAVYWLRMPLAESQGRGEALSDGEVRAILGLEDKGEASGGEDLPSMPGEMMNGFMRGWAPNITSLGDQYPVEISISDDWSLEAIAQAIQANLKQSLAGINKAEQLTDVMVSYDFSLPENARSGDVLEIPYYALFSTVYTVEGYAPEEFSLSTGPFTARVTLAGSGGALMASQDFLDKQAVYRQLESCTQGIALEAVSGGSFDLAVAVQDAMEAKLKAAGLAEDYRITVLSLGSYTAPPSLSPGAVQTITGFVGFSPTGKSGISIPDIPFTVTCATVAG